MCDYSDGTRTLRVAESHEIRREARRAISAAEVSEFTQACVLAVADYDVVENGNAEERSSGGDPVADTLLP
jgi:hypothetical protein